MLNEEARARIDLIIPELEEMAFVLKLLRDDRPVEAGDRLDEGIARCAPAPVVPVVPGNCPMPNPLSSCGEFLALQPGAVLRAVEQLMGAQMQAVRRLCELYEAAGPLP